MYDSFSEFFNFQFALFFLQSDVGCTSEVVVCWETNRLKNFVPNVLETLVVVFRKRQFFYITTCPLPQNLVS